MTKPEFDPNKRMSPPGLPAHLADAINPDTPTTGVPTDRVSRNFQLGDFKITSLLDVTGLQQDPKDEYARDVAQDEFAQVSRDNFLSTDEHQFFITPTLIDTGKERVLMDAGMGKGGLAASMAKADVDPASVDTVVITHMHPDHIGGLLTEGKPTFPNARYVAGAKEYDFWKNMPADNFPAKLVSMMFTPLAEKTTFIGGGDAAVSGITAIESFGHSPGHLCFMLESNNQQMVLTADLANHYVWSFAKPDWAFGFDGDPDAGAVSRRKVLGMIAADKIPMVGYHMPFPGVGYVETREDGFRFVPASYQMHG